MEGAQKGFATMMYFSRIASRIVLFFAALAIIARLINVSFVYTRSFAQGADISMPTELRSFYDSYKNLIDAKIKIATDPTQPPSERLQAFNWVRLKFPYAAIQMGASLAQDTEVTLATEATKFISSFLVMKDIKNSGESQQLESGLVILRKLATDPRPELREIAAATLASLNDEQILGALKQANEQGKISDSETLRYMTLAKPALSGKYVADFLSKDNTESQIAAIAFLGSMSDYRISIREAYLTNKSAPVPLRSAAAAVLAKTDPDLGAYAARIVGDKNLPDTVFESFMTNLNPQLPANVLHGIAAQSTANTERKVNSFVDSLERIQTIRPDVSFK